MPQPLLDRRRDRILSADNKLPGFEVVPRSPTASLGGIFIEPRDWDYGLRTRYDRVQGGGSGRVPASIC